MPEVPEVPDTGNQKQDPETNDGTERGRGEGEGGESRRGGREDNEEYRSNELRVRGSSGESGSRVRVSAEDVDTPDRSDKPDGFMDELELGVVEQAGCLWGDTDRPDGRMDCVHTSGGQPDGLHKDIERAEVDQMGQVGADELELGTVRWARGSWEGSRSEVRPRTRMDMDNRMDCAEPSSRRNSGGNSGSGASPYTPPPKNSTLKNDGVLGHTSFPTQTTWPWC
ncbi:hypothetical protein B0H14DRAFT_2558394 [Mycena olivaceomarginata]|nr:hypothetical protein B0H14DRAFT_2558394 [Mycena olivaceomarginata]